jgi:hypothetical protein
MSSEIYTADYGRQYDPPIPQVEITISRLRGRDGLTLTAIVDSGADATIIPIAYLRRIRAQRGIQKWLRGMSADRRRVTMYSVFLQLGPFNFYLPVVGDDLYDEPIIGRDVLNHLIVTLNGLANMVEISQ